MLLAAGDSSVFLQYAVSFFGLSIPFIVIAVLPVIWVHYRGKARKKKLPENDFAAEAGMEELPEKSQLMPPLSATERLQVIKKCRKELSGSKARYVALKYDYISLQRKATGLYSTSPDKKNKSMENFEEKIAAYEKQITGLQGKIEMLETIPPPGQNEAHYLRELLAEKEKEIQALRSSASPVQEMQADDTASEFNQGTINEQQQEITRLKKLVDEQAHISDMLDESRQQIGFLQNQLEQRVKANKIMEQKVATAAEEVNQAQSLFHAAEKKMFEVESELKSKQTEIEQLNRLVSTKESDLQRLQEEINFKSDQLLVIENSFNEIRRQNELLNASVADNQDVISSLREQLAGERNQNENLNVKLSKNSQILHRFYRELESSVEGLQAAEKEKLAEIA